MKITNKLGLPQPLVDALQADEREPKEGFWSVTELLKPTRIAALTRRHYGEMEEDASDRLEALFGTAVHGVLESFAGSGAAEVSVSYGRLRGRIDLYDADRAQVVDYKTCSVGKVMREDFGDWRLQGLMYAWLLWKNGAEPPRSMRFVALLKDWSKLKAARSAGYPKSAVYVYERRISDSDYDGIEAIVNARLRALDEAMALPDGELPPCTDEDAWASPEKWAAYKGSAKRALKLCDTREEAEAIGDRVEHRPGERIRCAFYCPCLKWCAAAAAAPADRGGGKEGCE